MLNNSSSSPISKSGPRPTTPPLHSWEHERMLTPTLPLNDRVFFDPTAKKNSPTKPTQLRPPINPKDDPFYMEPPAFPKQETKPSDPLLKRSLRTEISSGNIADGREPPPLPLTDIEITTTIWEAFKKGLIGRVPSIVPFGDGQLSLRRYTGSTRKSPLRGRPTITFRAV